MTETLKITLNQNAQNVINFPGNEGISYAGYEGSVIFKESRESTDVLVRFLPDAGLTLDTNGATLTIDEETAQDLFSAGAAYYCLEAESANKSHVVKIEAPVGFE